MKAKSLYFTKTGHSKRIARYLEKELGIEALDCKKRPLVEGLDLLFVIGGIYGGKSDPKFLEYLDRLDSTAAKKAVLMTSCTSNRSPQQQVRQTLEAKGIFVAEEEFICKGSFLIFAKGHPNQEDLENAAAFAKAQLNQQID